VPGGVYNVASGYGVSIKDIIALVQKVTGQAVSIDYQAARSIDVPAIWLDIRKFRAATGWQPTIGLEEGIRSLWQSLTAKDK
jgi:UDP-glucose 4-epimerase